MTALSVQLASRLLFRFNRCQVVRIESTLVRMTRPPRLLLVCLLLAGSCTRPESGAEGPAGGEGREHELLADDDALGNFLAPVPAKEPSAALATFEVVDGFHVELVAAEPLVTDPVACAFDAFGQLYVTEMRDYPYQPREGDKPIGRVRLLVDGDGDGRFDRSHVFADELLWPSGIAPWMGGVFVAAAPDIWYMRDTDGDGRADVRRKVYTGFGRQGEQYMLNNLIWGIDHWIYGATAGNGGAVRPADDGPAAPVSVDGRDFRFDPVTGEFESTSSTFQFGNTFDDWYNRFVCNQGMPARHVVLPGHYLARNAHLRDRDEVNALAEGWTRVYKISPIEAWRRIRRSRRIAAGRSPHTPGVSHDFLTAGAGVTVYRGDAYPNEYRGNIFIGATTGNLVHRRILEPDGATFRSARREKNTEFLRSTDNWFRPVNLANAPDGCLYVLDMSREFVESVHLSTRVVKHLDLTSGRDRGRIYRIAPESFEAPPRPRLGAAAVTQLVAELESANGWRRETAHRLIYERQDRSAIEPLRRLIVESVSPLARLHALWSLEGLGALRATDIAAGLADVAAGVREHSVRLAESRLDDSEELFEGVLALVGDDSARVRLQVALSLGESENTRSIDGLFRVARRDAGDGWIRTAVLSSSVDRADVLFDRLLEDRAFVTSEAAAELLGPLARMIGAARESEAAGKALDAIATCDTLPAGPALRESLVIELAEGLREKGLSELTALPGMSPVAAGMVADLLDGAREGASDENAEIARRLRAIRLLRHAGSERVGGILSSMLGSGAPVEVQLAAVDALAGFDMADVAASLLDRWSRCLPALRRKVVRELLSRETWTLPLLRAIEEGAVPVSAIEPARRSMLVEHRDVSIRTLANALFARAVPGPREEVIDRYRPSVALPADRDRGEKVHARECAVCHRLGTTVHPLGPNLLLSSQRDRETLLINILDPNRFVDPQYVQYLVVENSGRVYTGLVAAENARSVTLRRGENDEVTILKKDIRELRGTGTSMMPEGLESRITKQEMADLIDFLIEAQYDPGTDPGTTEPDNP